MIIAALLILGLCLGSFVNALVWRVHEQERTKSKKRLKDLSIMKGRSMCTHCGHELSTKDLIPLLSWLFLMGRCRYCKEVIGWQYPVVEAVTAVLFIVSYLAWPLTLDVAGTITFLVWLLILVGMVALFVFDLRWMLLPNRIVFPLVGLAIIMVAGYAISLESWSPIFNLPISIVISSGIFYLLFQISGGKWIGGGDVKLGLVIGLIVADPFKAFLVLFAASLLGTVYVLPVLLLGRLTPTNRIPFGPFLLLATFLVVLFGASAINWYKELIMFASIYQ